MINTTSLGTEALGEATVVAPEFDSYVSYFLSSNSDVIQYETLEIAHPNFTQVFYVVRNNTRGITATLENGTSINFVYYPLKITPQGDRNNLDQVIQIEVGDLGEVLPIQLDAVMAADGMATKPTVKYRTYRSDRLNQVMYGPLLLNISSLAFNRSGVVFEARAPSLNVGATGELYTLDRFPMLRGFL